MSNTSAALRASILTIPITAITTAFGRGNIGMIHVSGPDIRAIMHAVCGRLLTPRQAAYLSLPDANDNVIDRGITLWSPAPHPYTSGDILELQGRDGPVVMQLPLQHCLTADRGISLCVTEPDEFTRCAFLNGKMDLTQAEAVTDLIEAGTEAAIRSAARSPDDAFL